MPELCPAGVFLKRTEIILDVRSPLEFKAGHIPGAVNLPLFSNQERAAVGTTYKQSGPEEAMLLGLQYAGPKMADLLRTAKRLAASRESVRMYCFRGGQRSQSLAWLLEKGGLRVCLLENGYKAYRRYVLESFREPQEILVLSGCTGSGKTRLLLALARKGEQIIDLEGLASHRGSAFGGFDQPADLTTEMFQNRLHECWLALCREQRVWVEDEGRTLGKLLVPQEFWNQMREAPVIFLDIDQRHRVSLLVEEYGDLTPQFLADSVDRISKRLGHQNTVRCKEALRLGEHAEVAKICLDYYDKAYLHCLEKRQPQPLWRLELPGVDTESNAQALFDFAQGKTATLSALL